MGDSLGLPRGGPLPLYACKPDLFDGFLKSVVDPCCRLGFAGSCRLGLNCSYSHLASYDWAVVQLEFARFRGRFPVSAFPANAFQATALVRGRTASDAVAASRDDEVLSIFCFTPETESEVCNRPRFDASRSHERSTDACPAAAPPRRT